MSKRVRILVAPTCVSVMLSAVVPVFAKNDQETLDVQSAIEYLLSQDASDNVKVSFRMCDHGDRSGGLLIGYVGLITVPVACN